jgi:hypothetical protein
MSKQDAVDFQLFKSSIEHRDSATVDLLGNRADSISMLSRKGILGVHVMADANMMKLPSPKCSSGHTHSIWQSSCNSTDNR